MILAKTVKLPCTTLVWELAVVAIINIIAESAVIFKILGFMMSYSSFKVMAGLV